jgi:hypothetical protein
MRDTVPMDRIEMQESAARQILKGAISLTPPTEDAVEQTMETNREEMLEQEH